MRIQNFVGGDIDPGIPTHRRTVIRQWANIPMPHVPKPSPLALVDVRDGVRNMKHAGIRKNAMSSLGEIRANALERLGVYRENPPPFDIPPVNPPKSYGSWSHFDSSSPSAYSMQSVVYRDPFNALNDRITRQNELDDEEYFREEERLERNSHMITNDVYGHLPRNQVFPGQPPMEPFRASRRLSPLPLNHRRGVSLPDLYIPAGEGHEYRLQPLAHTRDSSPEKDVKRQKPKPKIPKLKVVKKVKRKITKRLPQPPSPIKMPLNLPIKRKLNQRRITKSKLQKIPEESRPPLGIVTGETTAPKPKGISPAKQNLLAKELRAAVDQDKKKRQKTLPRRGIRKNYKETSSPDETSDSDYTPKKITKKRATKKK